MEDFDLRKRLIDGIKNGSLHLTSPTGQPLRAWTKEERTRLEEVMKEIIRREKEDV